MLEFPCKLALGMNIGNILFASEPPQMLSAYANLIHLADRSQ
jgi:hypothetical protein